MENLQLNTEIQNILKKIEFITGIKEINKQIFSRNEGRSHLD